MTQAPALSQQTNSDGLNHWIRSLSQLLEVARKAIEKDQAVAKAAMGQASALLRVELDRQASPNEAGAAGLVGCQRQRIQTFIEENLDQTIHVKDLSEIARRSPAHFSRAFKRSFGETPHTYIIRCRLARAAHLMLSTDASLSEIALLCGFTDQAHLSNLFRQRVGASPGGWRQQRREAAGRKAAARCERPERPYVCQSDPTHQVIGQSELGQRAGR